MVIVLLKQPNVKNQKIATNSKGIYIKPLYDTCMSRSPAGYLMRDGEVVTDLKWQYHDLSVSTLKLVMESNTQSA
jgi:hypothetical protein